MKPGAHASRAGATLVYVILVCAILVMLTSSIAGLVRSRGRLAGDLLARAALRDAAEAALFQAADLLDADTNRVDTVLEPWGRLTADARERAAAGAPGVFVFIEDESARLQFPKTGPEALAEVLTLATGQEPVVAANQARVVYDWYENLSVPPADADGTATNRVFSAEEELLEAPLEAGEAFAAGLGAVTVHGDGKVNVHTVGHDVFVGLAVAQGAPREGAEALFRRLALVREQGVCFESTEPTEALKLLQGGGSLPTAAERAALMKLQRCLRVDAACFRITVLARDDSREVGLQAIYEPVSGRFLRWVSW